MVEFLELILEIPMTAWDVLDLVRIGFDKIITRFDERG